MVLYGNGFPTAGVSIDNAGLIGPFEIDPRDKVHFTFIGLSVLWLAVQLVNLFCPWLIKNFQDPWQCADSYLKMTDARHIDEVLVRMRKQKKRPWRSEKIIAALEGKKSELAASPEAWRDFLELNRESIYQLHVNWHGTFQNDRRFLRLGCILVLYLGFGLVALPSLDTLLAAMRVSLPKLGLLFGLG